MFRSRWLLRGMAALVQEPCLSVALRVPLFSRCPWGCGPVPGAALRSGAVGGARAAHAARSRPRCGRVSGCFGAAPLCQVCSAMRGDVDRDVPGVFFCCLAGFSRLEEEEPNSGLGQGFGRLGT